MNRTQKTDPAFDDLCEQRDHLAIQVSLAWDAQPADLVRLSELQRRLKALDLRISSYRPAEASSAGS